MRGHKCLARVAQSVVACAFFVLMVLLKAGCVRAPGKALTVFPGKSSGSVTLPCDGLLAVLAGELPPGSWLLGASVDGVLTGKRGWTASLRTVQPAAPRRCALARGTWRVKARNPRVSPAGIESNRDRAGPHPGGLSASSGVVTYRHHCSRGGRASQATCCGDPRLSGQGPWSGGG